MQPKSPPNPGRRKFLIGATSAVGAVGIAGAAVPSAISIQFTIWPQTYLFTPSLEEENSGTQGQT